MRASDSSIITAASGPTTLTGFAGPKDAQLMPEVRIEKEVCEATLKPIVRIYNNGSQPITSATLQSSLNGALSCRQAALAVPLRRPQVLW